MKITGKILRVILIVTAGILTIACSKEEAAKLEVSATKVEVVSPKATFTVTSNRAWVLSKKGNYNFRIAPTNGNSGTTEVSITYAANDSGTNRESVVTITAGDLVKTVNVVQPVASISFSPDTLIFEPVEATKTINVTANVDWDLNTNVYPEWVKSIEATGKTGNGTIAVAVKENKDRVSNNNWDLEVIYAGTLKKQIRIIQEVAYNNPPTKPVILTPANNATGVSVIPDFTWEAATDVEGDAIDYYVQVSKDGTTWDQFPAGKATKLSHSGTFKPLEPNTTYYYKVTANDNYNGGITDSEITKFTTSEKDAYTDGEYKLYMKSTKGEDKSFVVVFTGDGYLPEHHRYGGLFDQDMNTSIEGLFEIEPYKTYREYFTVYKIAAFSNEAGVTNNKTGVEVDTKFGSYWSGGNSTYLGTTAKRAGIYEWCEKIPEFKNRTKKHTAVAVIINADVYAGTCTMWSNGESIALMTYNRNAGSVQTEFVNTVKHELGGHGIGRLADEYTTSSGFYPEDSKAGLREWQGYGTYLNVTVEPNIADSPWAHFIDVEGYSHVDMFEGAAGYKQGVWKPEKTSCMISNLPYFNSPSRFYIVKRILEMAGEIEPIKMSDPQAVKLPKLKALMDKFIEKDVQKTNPYLSTQSSNTYYPGWGGVPYDFIPLAPPVLLKEGEE